MWVMIITVVAWQDQCYNLVSFDCLSILLSVQILAKDVDRQWQLS